MKVNVKNNFFGYYQFFYKVLGARLLVDMFQSILVSFFDGIGLAMFIPLLQSMASTENQG